MRPILAADEQTGEWFKYTHGTCQVILDGAQTGATYTLQARRAGGDAVPVTDAHGAAAKLTADGTINVYLAGGIEYRLAGDSASAIGAVAVVAHVAQ